MNLTLDAQAQALMLLWRSDFGSVFCCCQDLTTLHLGA
jgi:hypothetical protein